MSAWVRARSGLILQNGVLKGYNNESTFTFDTEDATLKHHRMKYGKAILKSLNGTTVQMQVRNATDTGYASISASDFSPGSRLEWKKNIEPYLDDALTELLNTNLCRYHLNEDNDNEMKRIGFIYEYSPVDAIDPAGYGMSTYG